MIAWFIISLALLVWNAIYCTRKIVIDFRGPKPASGVWGLFALAGALSTLSIGLVAVLVSFSGI